MNENFIWKIKDLDETHKQNIKIQIIEKISNTKQFENTPPIAIINKNPKGGADIIISNDEFIVEGYYQVHRSSVTLIRWADNPLPGTQ